MIAALEEADGAPEEDGVAVDIAIGSALDEEIPVTEVLAFDNSLFPSSIEIMRTIKERKPYA